MINLCQSLITYGIYIRVGCFFQNFRTVELNCVAFLTQSDLLSEALLYLYWYAYMYIGLRRGKMKPKKEKQEEPAIAIREYSAVSPHDYTISHCPALSQIDKEETIDVLNFYVKLEHQKYLDRLAPWSLCTVNGEFLNGLTFKNH